MDKRIFYLLKHTVCVMVCILLFVLSDRFNFTAVSFATVKKVNRIMFINVMLVK